jgi:hypothetical protein
LLNLEQVTLFPLVVEREQNLIVLFLSPRHRASVQALLLSAQPAQLALLA